MSYLENSLFFSLLLRFWNWVCARFQESLAAKFLTKLIRGFTGGSVWRFLTKDGRIGTGLQGSLLIRAIQWCLDLPVRFMAFLGSKSPMGLLPRIFGALVVPALGVMILLLMIIPQEMWNNLYSLVMVLCILALYLAASLSGAEQAIAFCEAHPVDLVIMDVMMKYGLDGLTCAKTIHHNNPEVKIILTTSTAEARWIDEAREAGIDSFWFKEYSDIPLTEVMDRTMAGERVFPDSPPNPDFGDAVKTDFSERELEVLRELTRNLTNEEIAEKLCISPHTVKRHIENMLIKTGYRNRIDLAVNAKALGMVVHEEDRTENRSRKGGERA